LFWQENDVTKRTTLSLDDDLIEPVKAFAASRDLSLGQAVSELVRQGLRAPLRTKIENGFVVVDLPPPVVTDEHVRKLLDEMI
jgi:Family of unknown function (DUF6364)